MYRRSSNAMMSLMAMSLAAGLMGTTIEEPRRYYSSPKSIPQEERNRRNKLKKIAQKSKKRNRR